MIRDKNNMSYKYFLMLQETERSRIAEDLHDTTVQELVALSQKLDLANLYFDKDVTQARLELISAKKQIKDIIEDIRNTIYDLRPMSFDDFGWDASIERLYRDVDQKSDMNVTFDIDSINSVDNVIQITVYRILREAVTNVYKHAKASRLYVTLHIQNKEIYLEIRDDGIGIQSDIKENHFGMQFMNGIEALQEIRKKKLKTKVIILTVHNEIEYLLRAVDIGIDGYVLKDSDAHELIRAVTSVYEGDKFIQPSLIPLLNSKLIARDLDAERLEQLSKREIEVLKLVAVGMFNKEIGVELGISERTVKNHLSSIFKKIDSSDRTQAAVFAIRNGLVDIK